MVQSPKTHLEQMFDIEVWWSILLSTQVAWREAILPTLLLVLGPLANPLNDLLNLIIDYLLNTFVD